MSATVKLLVMSCFDWLPVGIGTITSTRKLRSAWSQGQNIPPAGWVLEGLANNCWEGMSKSGCPGADRIQIVISTSLLTVSLMDVHLYVL
ncbi:uncharacterized protein P884DRAFT_264852 [Thermothelomyces heterothallicus CBS 202.75]|uniref:uncharacterized protein n=1 Tax=Thermothelomyces heterothallicus CBS 202.75 TaxID=1149848 RepID=UPI0037424A22